ncbi:MAG: winged helix-turn-helix domain-containing protein [Gammaproteobacteria bacterium]|nr:winged helix-turn-helix domain-containing protein [Gammaproteobacteria bacterium]
MQISARQNVEILNQHSFVIDDWTVSPAESVLSRGNEVVRLEPKVMEVLVYFASRPSEVISREELERDVWHGAVIGYDAVTATVIKLRKALQDNAKQPRIIATIPKRGYQLIARVSAANHDDVAATTTPQPPSAQATAQLSTRILTKNRSPRFLRMGIFGVIVAALLMFISTQLTLLPDKALPSIVVLPIDNLDASAEYDIFVDGITEDIVTDLSRMANLMVFASNTTFKYKGQKITPQALRSELHVDYVLTGNARRNGDDIRINLQLINTESGVNVWAQRYDRKVVEVFSVQDEISNSLIKALAVKLSSREKRQLLQRATNNLEAYEYFLQGQRLSIEQTKQTNAQARAAYTQAIDIDPAYGRAYGALAYTLALDFRHGWTNTPVENLERALILAEQGVALDGSIPQTYWSLGYVHLRRNEYEKAKIAAKHSIRIAPNYADGYGLLALISNGLGQADKALEYATRGMQLNPFYTWDYLLNVGLARYLLGNYAQAVESLEKAQDRNENAIPIKLYLAASYVNVNRLDDAQWTIEQIGVLNPSTTISHLASTMMLSEPKQKAKLLADLRKAGLPE